MTGALGPGYWLSRAIVAGLFWGCYMGLVGKPSVSEAVAGALVTLAALAMLVYLEAASGRPFHFKAAWWLDLGRLPGRIVSDAVKVSAALITHMLGLGPLDGRFMAIPFPDRPDDEAMEARLALMTLGTSVSPNAFVLDVDRDRRLVLVHELVWTTDQPPASVLWWPR